MGDQRYPPTTRTLEDGDIWDLEHGRKDLFPVLRIYYRNDNKILAEQPTTGLGVLPPLLYGEGWIPPPRIFLPKPKERGEYLRTKGW